jgi:hypothetical protein
MVTIFAENTSKREIILINRRMLRAIKIIPDGRAGRNGLISGILWRDKIDGAIVELGGRGCAMSTWELLSSSVGGDND